MSVKKNLTVAGLAALLAVPAFGANNAPRALHMSSTEAHAADVAELQNNPKFFHNPDRSIPEDVNHNFTRNGHTFDVKTIQQQETNGAQGDIDPIITGVDGNNNLSNAQVIAALEGSTTSNNQSNSSNRSTQYASKNNLPQTGEVNHQASELAASIVLGATSVGLGAMAMRKHKKDKDVASVAPIQTSSSSCNDDNNKVDNIIDTLGTEANKLNNYIYRMSNK